MKAYSHGSLVTTTENEDIKILPHVNHTVILYIKGILPS